MAYRNYYAKGVYKVYLPISNVEIYLRASSKLEAIMKAGESRPRLIGCENQFAFDTTDAVAIEMVDGH